MEIGFKSSDLNNIKDLRILKNDDRDEIYISIIIPCYNVENYIDRCMRSVVNQTIGLERLQIIAINDASTDNTLSKLIKWKERFQKEITVISYDENLRQGGARNIGMQCADGEYLGFVDSDDWIEPDMYERLYEKAKEKKYDIIRGKFIREHFVGEKDITNAKQEDVSYEFMTKDGWYVYDTPNVGCNGEIGGIWSAIYRKELILENKVWGPENRAYEENYWGSIVNLYTKNTDIVDRIIYHYFINECSTVTEKNALHQLDRLNIEVLKVEEYKRRGAFDALYINLEFEFIKLFYLNTLYIIFTRFDFIPDIYGFMKYKIYLYFPDFLENPRISECTQREQLLLSLLEIPRILSVDDLNRIKIAYLKTF